MNQELRIHLINIAKEKIPDSDVSHDFEHALRVLSNAESIAKKEGGDLDIIVPAALFHDLIVYPKNHPEKHKSQEESAQAAEKILNKLGNFPKETIGKVKICNLECSFSKGIIPKFLESKILQDADGLEATGAISIMRTYSSTGQMKRLFYNSENPFCTNRKPDSSRFALDLFYERLLVVGDRMHTKTAKKIASRRTDFLLEFLKEFKLELEGK
jgi:uncharacterized protein